jgi:glycosyltransferase involved in cell wall biosynthesis
LKIHLYCNTLNISYNIGRFLREYKYDVTLFLDNTTGFEQDFPWHQDNSISEKNLPDWIVYHNIRPDFVKLNAETKILIEAFSKCDVALVWGWGPILCHLAKVPYFFCSLGTDLNNIKISEKIRKFVYTKFSKNNSTKKSSPTLVNQNIDSKNSYSGLSKALHYRKQLEALRKSTYAIGVGMGYQINPYIKPFGLMDKMVKIRVPYDLDFYKKKENKELSQKYETYNCIFFAPARQSWRSVWEDIKGNDKYIKAFATHIKKYPNCKLVMVEKGIDVNLSKKLIQNLNIENFVEWIPELDKQGVVEYLSIPNSIFIDQFMHDEWYIKFPEDKEKVRVGFGFASIEALALEKVVITAFTDEFFYDNNQPPILKAFSIGEIEKAMATAYSMSTNERFELGKKAREFATKYHDWKNNIHIYTDVLTDIYNKTKLVKP